MIILRISRQWACLVVLLMLVCVFLPFQPFSFMSVSCLVICVLWSRLESVLVQCVLDMLNRSRLGLVFLFRITMCELLRKDTLLYRLVGFHFFYKNWNINRRLWLLGLLLPNEYRLMLLLTSHRQKAAQHAELQKWHSQQHPNRLNGCNRQLVDPSSGKRTHATDIGNSGPISRGMLRS